MEDSTNLFVEFVSLTWQKHEREVLEAGLRSRLQRNDERQTLGIEVEGQRKLASIQVWERANCLDVVVMELPAKNSRILGVGPCSSFAEAEARLGALRAVLLEPWILNPVSSEWILILVTRSTAVSYGRPLGAEGVSRPWHSSRRELTRH